METKTLRTGNVRFAVLFNATWSRPYCIFDEHLKIKMVGFTSERLALSTARKLEKDPTYRGY